MTGEELLLGFQGIYGGVTEEDVSKFLKTIFGYEGQLHDVSIFIMLVQVR
jgi:hypothetical protein